MMKRSSDLQMSNGTYMETEIHSSDPKKAKMEGSRPSRVLHIRGVPNDATEGEIVQLGMPFGRMTNLVLARKKNQALLEMADIETAQAMLQYYSERPPQIRNHRMLVQFSNHEVLKTDNNTTRNLNVQAALQAADQMLDGTGRSYPSGSGDRGGASVSGSQTQTVLRVMIDNMLYPITIDILKQIFSKYGQVLKIVTFNKNNTFQALVQYSDAVSAQSGKSSLNGQNIYNGCCTLHIDFSKLPELNIKYNNDKSWDYTNPNLPSGDPMMSQSQQNVENTGDGILGQFGSPQMLSNFSNMGAGNMNFGMSQRMPGMAGGNMSGLGTGAMGSGAMGSGMSGGMGTSLSGLMGAMGGNMAGMGGGMNRMGSSMGMGAMGNSMGLGMGSMGGNMGSGMGMQMGNNMGGMGIMGGNMPSLSQMSGMGLGMGNMGMRGGMGSGMSNMGGMTGVGGSGGASSMSGGCVVIISNLNEENINPDAIFTLFGVYGIVQRVKILYNKKDTALVQFSDPLYAQNSITSLDKVEWRGKNLKVSMSKHQSVQLPRDGVSDSWMTKDYTNSNQHRFRNPTAKSYTNVYPPTATLHLSNVPASVTEADLTELFSQYGQVLNFKFFEKDRKMALIQLSSQEQAIEALVALHNHNFGGGNGYLRVSFTKSVI